MLADIERLRKFALVAALALLGYIASGVTLEAGAKVLILGIPFVISKPEMLPLILILASFYGLARYFYYGVMLNKTPYRRRNDLLKELTSFKKDRPLAGQHEYTTSPMTPNRVEVEALANSVIDVYPKVTSAIPLATIERTLESDDGGEPYLVFVATIKIPFVCRIAATIEDIDYMTPVLLNIVALTWGGYVLWRH